jgi:polar amino acid transport system permease protein
MIWDWEFAVEIMPILLQAMLITIGATLAAFVVALLAGLGLALLRFSSPLQAPKRGIRWRLLGGAVEFVRTTPILVQLYFAFYVLPTVGITLPPFVVGMLVLGLHYATYLSEVYRAGIESVARHQWEAGRALNHSRRHMWGRVILPQAVPPMLPVLGNYFIALLKETPFLSAITIVEMLARAKIIGIEYYRYLEPLTIVGILFIVLSVAGAFGVRGLESWNVRRLSQGRTSARRARPEPKGAPLT